MKLGIYVNIIITLCFAVYEWKSVKLLLWKGLIITLSRLENRNNKTTNF
jgi:hypothetical protein